MRTRLFSRSIQPVYLSAPVALRIWSGAQTGVDRGAHDVALSLGLPIYGWIPKHRLARDPIPEIYLPMLKEMTDEEFPCLKGVEDKLEIYKARTEENAKSGDGTVVFIQKEEELCGGTLYTAQMAEKHKRPCLIFKLSSHLTKVDLIDWIVAHGIKDLNVGGPNEEKSPGIYVATFNFMTEFLLAYRAKTENTVTCYNTRNSKIG